MGNIKRGVSLYSYQQAQFFKILDVWDQIREVREGCLTDGIEIISQQAIYGYPFPSDSWVKHWFNVMEEYNMNAVAYDPHLDVLQFRDHVMDAAEGADRLKRDIRLAKRLGFKIVRVHQSQTMPDNTMAIFEKCLPVAQELDIPMALEIHAPMSLRGKFTTDIIEYAEKHDVVDHLGIYPDLGIYQKRVQTPLAEWYVRKGCSREVLNAVQDVCDTGKLDQISPNLRTPESFQNYENYTARGIELPDDADPGIKEYIDFIKRIVKNPTPRDYDLFGWPLKLPKFDGSELRDVIKYVKGFHAKFYDMTEIPGNPGHYEDISIDYETPFRVLKETGWEGYLNSENEGQRHYQDQTFDKYQDDIEQARRNHEWMARLCGEEFTVPKKNYEYISRL